ncbi:MAG TPA: DNA repair protein RecO [Bacteroidia bacterium]|nr:DNA repair protein RecO [Bacteroidia bacterium]
MRISAKAIILQNIQHGDNKRILKLYTRHEGLLTVSLRTLRTSKSGISKASIQPMSFIEAEVLYRANRDIHLLTEARTYKVHEGLRNDIAKLAIAQFIQDVLNKSLREHQGNEALYDFLETCFDFLDHSEKGFSNLHLHFIMELSHHLGFEPQNNRHENAPFFDFREGQFGAAELVWPLGLARMESELLSDLFKQGLLKATLSRQQRQFFLECMMNYFAFHVPGFVTVKSLEVLKELFEDQ